MPTHDEHQVSTKHFPPGEQIGEGGGIERPACGIEKNLLRTGMFQPEIVARFQFRHLGLGITARSLDIVGRHRIGVRVFGFADVIKKDLHSAGRGTSLASRHRRSSE